MSVRAVDAPPQAGVKYFIVVDGYSGACGDYILSVSCNPACPPFPGASDLVSNVPGGPGTGDGVSPSPGQAERGGSDPSSSTRLIQTLLHLSRNPRGPHHAGPAPRPSTPQPSPLSMSPSPSPTQQPVASPAAGRRSQTNTRTPPISSAVRPALNEGSPSAASLPAGAGTEPGQQQAVQGPIGVLLGNSAGAARAHASPPANYAAEVMTLAQGPLGAIQASSSERANSVVEETAQQTLTESHGDAAVIELREGDDVLAATAAPSLAAAAEPVEATGDSSVGSSRNHTSEDSTRSTVPRQDGSVLHSDGPEGRRPQQVELVADLGPGPISLKHAGDEEDAAAAAATTSPAPPSEGLFQTGLAHGAGGFSAGRGSAGRPGPGKQSSRFADLDTLLGTSRGNSPGGLPAASPQQKQRVDGSDAGGGWEAAKANLAALSSESEQLLPVDGRR